MTRRSTTTLLVLLLGLATPALASDDPRYLPAEAQEAWAKQLADAQARVERAEQERATADAALSEARHEQYPRGEDLAAIERRFTAAERELADAREALDRLVEKARRSGVLPEVLRPYR